MKSNRLIILVQPKHGIWDSIFIRVPESLLAVAALPHANGYTVKIIDQRVDHNWEDTLHTYLTKSPLCVGITSLTGPSLRYALEAAKLVKEHDARIPVVFGGVHATLLPEQTLMSTLVDIVVKGEGDLAFLNLIKTLEESGNLASVKGIVYKDQLDDNLIKSTGDELIIRNLDDLTETPYQLIDLEKYSAVDLGRGKSISLQTSRGCPFACRFCGNNALQHSLLRTMSVPKLVGKIEMLQDRYGYNTFLFLDDCTSANIHHFRALISALANLQTKIAWCTVGIRADLICQMTDTDMELLWESGCRALDIGVETGSDRMLQYIQKGETKAQIRLANKKLAPYPIHIKYTFVVGLPTETIEDRNETLEFYLELSQANSHVYPMVFVYVPIVGTALFEEIVQSGFAYPKSIEEWESFDSKSWLNKYDSWIDKKLKRQLETMMISAIFCNSNASLKFTTTFSRAAFKLYHPVARLRFKYKWFGLPVEAYLSDLVSRMRK